MADETKKYKHYKDVAIKHFHALQMMREKLEDMQGKENESEYKHLLYDAYYLSGYILEEASIYIIFKYLQWNPNKDIPIQNTLPYLLGIIDRGNDYTDNYLCDPSNPPEFHFTWEGKGCSGPNKIESNTFLGNLNSHAVFEYTKSLYTGCKTEPFFCGDCHPDNSISNTNCPQLLKMWNPDKRYFLEEDFTSNGLTISYDDIESIENFCQVYIINYIKKH